MRVQPHFPSRPLLATVMSRSGLALCACNAANSPAPPEPRIKTSVSRRSRFMRSSKHAREKYERNDRRHSDRERGELLLSVAPVEILDYQDPQSSQHVHREQEHETALGDLDERLIAPTQERFERRFTANGEAERQEMQRQEDGQRQTGQPVHQRRDPEHAPAMVQPARRHHSVTAATARRPRISSAIPNAIANIPAPRSASGDHSARTLRTPIAA